MNFLTPADAAHPASAPANGQGPSAEPGKASMRIVLLAVDDEFAGEMQRFLYETHPGWIVGSVISSCAIYRRSKLGGMWFVLRTSGWVFLAEMIRMKLVRGFLDRHQRCFPSQLARAHQVETFVTANINSETSLAKLRSWRPDLIISTNFSHYIGRTARESIARHGCWNLHKSYLPHYRGMAPSFHALLEGAKQVGATLHVVSKGFDEGGLLAQVKVPVRETDTVYSLNRNTSEAGGKMLAQFLASCDLTSIQAAPQPVGNWRNYTYPTRAEVSSFRRKGLKFYAHERNGN
jgi:folate-dependent phosphoribosylglycinamide formyltransferase PurN